jgi:transcriptional regulator with XRE-family HTH domain
MGFKENLKSELAYKDMLVKELATLSGINRRTIDNYLRVDGSMPSADAAVRIARVLGVTVEYLISGHELQEQITSQLLPDPRVMLKTFESLNKRDRKIVQSLIKSLKEIEESEKSTSKNEKTVPDALLYSSEKR